MTERKGRININNKYNRGYKISKQKVSNRQLLSNVIWNVQRYFANKKFVPKSIACWANSSLWNDVFFFAYYKCHSDSLCFEASSGRTSLAQNKDRQQKRKFCFASKIDQVGIYNYLTFESNAQFGSTPFSGWYCKDAH